MAANVFITGNSSGIGLALSRHCLDQGNEVYGLSRRGCPLHHESLHDLQADLGILDELEEALQQLLGDTGYLQLVILNAGVLGQVRLMQDSSLEDLKVMMDVNLWCNKIILDWLLKKGVRVEQVILVSSGAAVNGGKGWGGYSLSKAALNMLAELYAHEFVDSHLCALAPGLVDTAMQAYISGSGNVDTEKFPGFRRLQQARGTDAMPDPDAAAQNILNNLDRLAGFPSGSFIDIRTLV